MDGFALDRLKKEEENLHFFINSDFLFFLPDEIRVTTSFMNYLNPNPWPTKPIENPIWYGIPIVIDDFIDNDYYKLIYKRRINHDNRKH